LNRAIGHIDLDYFYAQVEEVENPAIKDKPVIVCVFSGRTEDSGAVATANYKARELGVSSGIPIVVAKRKLKDKDPVIIRMERAKYEVVSERVMALVEAEVDVLEQTGIDEAFFDVTKRSGSDYQTARQISEKIKGSILKQEHLTCSVGLGRSKVVAKLCSDMAKPGGIMVVPSDSTESFLKDLPVEKLYGVGPKTSGALEALHIKTVHDLALADVGRLESKFGKKLAVYLHSSATGEDDEPVTKNEARSQLMRVITLKHDTTDADEALTELAEATQDLRDRLQSQSLSFRTVTAIAILTDLSTKTRGKTFETPINDLGAVKDDILGLFEDLSTSVDKQFRRVGIRVSEFSNNQDQSSLSEFLQPAR
jgi:DNA polymerase IV (archaeal DinB-like DNA polymerase)